MLKRTDFGPGAVASLIYWTSSVATMFWAFVSMHGEGPHGPLTLISILKGWGIVVVTVLACGRLGLQFSRHHKAREQSKRDSRSREILIAARESRAPDFSLYLRAFETTGRMQAENRDDAPLGNKKFDERPPEEVISDFETTLARAVERQMPLVALGRPGEQLGAGRVLSTEENWKQDLAVLAEAAHVIFIFPSVCAGTLWEFDWILERGLTEKPVFVDPLEPSKPALQKLAAYCCLASCFPASLSRCFVMGGERSAGLRLRVSEVGG